MDSTNNKSLILAWQFHSLNSFCQIFSKATRFTTNFPRPEFCLFFGIFSSFSSFCMWLTPPKPFIFVVQSVHWVEWKTSFSLIHEQINHKFSSYKSIDSIHLLTAAVYWASTKVCVNFLDKTSIVLFLDLSKNYLVFYIYCVLFGCEKKWELYSDRKQRVQNCSFVTVQYLGATGKNLLLWGYRFSLWTHSKQLWLTTLVVCMATKTPGSYNRGSNQEENWWPSAQWVTARMRSSALASPFFALLYVLDAKHTQHIVGCWRRRSISSTDSNTCSWRRWRRIVVVWVLQPVHRNAPFCRALNVVVAAATI